MIELLLMAQLAVCNPQIDYKAEDYEYEYYELLEDYEQLQEDYDELEEDEYQPPNYDD